MSTNAFKVHNPCQGLILKRYTPINPVLKKLVKFYWTLKSKKETAICGKLIPMNNIDLIINLSAPIKYRSANKEECFKDSHFIGIQDSFMIVEQEGILDVFGISFSPAGFYPVIKEPLSKFANKIVLIDQIIPAFKNIAKEMADVESNKERVAIIEELLINVIDFKLLPNKNYDSLINDFLTHGETLNIKDYCKNHFYNQRTVERFFKKYIGITPKTFLMNTKFQKSIKSLRMGNVNSMAQLGYEFNYYDQTHFINSFKSFMGKTPAKQLKENDLILDILPKR
jgi:AraC-like DNA-binding protein